MVPARANYMPRIEDLRSQVFGLRAELPVQALNSRPIERADDHGTNSLAALAAHVAGREHFCLADVIGRRPETRDRPTEFAIVAISAYAVIQLVLETARKTTDESFKLGETALNGTRSAGHRPGTVRWWMLRTIDHTALHLRRMRLTGRLRSGGKSLASPPWSKRLFPKQDS